MTGEFINPNWHVVIMHFPLGLLGAGVVIELISLLWRGGGFRAAGRWMILLGSLMAIPTALLGIYAFRDVLLPGPVNPQLHWHDVVRQSRWTPEQWEFISDHIWLNSIASVIFLIVTVAWLAASDLWRRRLYWPCLILLLAGLGAMTAGAWHGGELVYRFGAGVNPEGGPGAVRPAPESQAEGSALGAHAGEQSGQQGAPAHAEAHAHEPAQAQPSAALKTVQYFLPPLQLHLTLAGFAVALAAGALGLTIRRWHASDADDLNSASETGFTDKRGRPAEVHAPRGPYDDVRGEEAQTAVIFPRRFWLLAALAALLAAVAGDWSVIGTFTIQALRDNLHELTEPSHRRLLAHVIFGVTIILLPLVLGIPARLARRHRVFSGLLALLLFAAIAIQVWLGVLMIYDSHSGPLTRFASSSVAASVPAEGRAGEPASHTHP